MGGARRTIGVELMDQALIVTAAVFASGFIVGYVIREGISRHRRAKAKRNRRFFYEGPLVTDTSYVNLSVTDKIANPTKTAGLNIPSEVTAASKRPIMSFQRGATVAVPSAPTVV